MADKPVAYRPRPLPGCMSDWRGYDCYQFAVDGSSVKVVAPKRIAEGKPWLWRARFFDHRPDVDLAVLELGFHLVFVEDDQEMLGNPQILGRWSTLYALLVEQYGFAPKCALEGLSRGGLYVYNWAAANPEKVACIYADAPVCNPRTWLARKDRATGAQHSWEAMTRSYGFTSGDVASANMATPLKGLETLAAARIPLLHVCGDADTLVPLEEHTRVLQQLYEALGGDITLILRHGSGHEHGLPDPSPIVDFIVKHTVGPGGTAPPLKDIHRIVFLGDGITYDGRYIQYIEAFLRVRYPDRDFELINLGVPNETVATPIEPGDARAAPSRPSPHERLAHAFASAQPGLVVACYGTDDGPCMTSNEDRLLRFQHGIERLREQVQSAGADLLLLTPPVFNAIAEKRPSGADDGIPDRGCVQQRYSAWLLAQRQRGWSVVDVYGAVARHLAAQRRRHPHAAPYADVHLSDLGHWVISREVLDAMGVPSELDGAGVELGILRAARGHITNLVAKPDEVAFIWRTRIPVRLAGDCGADPEGRMSRFGRVCLSAAGLPRERYYLFEGQTLIATLARDELAAGVDIVRLAKLSVHGRAADLLEKVAARQRLLRDAWMAHLGGTSRNVPFASAVPRLLEMAEQSLRAIRGAVHPVRLNLRLQSAASDCSIETQVRA